MADSIFTKIIKGEIPANKIFEDDKTLAIIPLHPIALGHVLVIPKVQVDQFIDLDDVDYVAVWTTVKMIGKHMREKLNPQRIGVQIVGTDVPHVHVHVIAFNTLDQFRELPDQSDPPEQAKMDELAKKLSF